MPEPRRRDRDVPGRAVARDPRRVAVVAGDESGRGPVPGDGVHLGPVGVYVSALAPPGPAPVHGRRVTRRQAHPRGDRLAGRAGVRRWRTVDSAWSTDRRRITWT